MADRLSESTWTTFTKRLKLDLEDKALVKALAGFDKAEDGQPAAKLAALQDVVEQAKKQVVAIARVKNQLGAKTFDAVKDKLYELLAAAEALQKSVAAGDKRAGKDSDEEEEESSPVLLTTKMRPLLVELRKGETRMHVMVCTAGKDTAVLIMRRPISPARRKLLADTLNATGAMKYAVGEVVFEAGAFSFTMQSPAAGLAKRLRAALLAQLELRLKVRVRGEDGEEEDGQDEQAADANAGTGATPGPNAERLAYEQRLREARDKVAQALRDGHPEAKKLRPLLDFAAAKGDERKEYAAAIKGLEALEKLIDGAAAAGRPQTTTDASAKALQAIRERLGALLPRAQDAVASGSPQAQAIKLQISEAGVHARNAKFAEANALLDSAERALAALSATQPGGKEEAALRKRWAPASQGWRDAVDAVDAQIDKLQSALKAMDDAELKEIAEFGLPGVTGNHKARLTAAMMDLDRSHGDGLTKAAARVARLAQGFNAYLGSSEAVEAADQNPFGVRVSIRASLGKALQDVQRALAPSGA